MRADQRLVQQGSVPTRSAAQRLISAGSVRWLSTRGWAVLRKAGEDVPEHSTLEITDLAQLQFVSRGGLKLEGALHHCGLSVAHAHCLDVGMSTGGFTDVLLQKGAAHVTGIEVGHSQLHPSLQTDARVQCFEKCNARDLTGSAFSKVTKPHSFDLIVGDLSFISSTLVWPALLGYLKPQGQLLWLVKPQFELQPEQIGKGGIVRNKTLFSEVETRIRRTCRDLALQVHGYFLSPLQGGNGNTEFFVWAQPGASL
jgi:23S rRNA (cytidine1920-2'-O)/16S rRNA (cytidine1409-2'-O)-methyltransferase